MNENSSPALYIMTTYRRVKNVGYPEQFGMILMKAGSRAEIARAYEKTGYISNIQCSGKDLPAKAGERYMENISWKNEYRYFQAAILKKKK